MIQDHQLFLFPVVNHTSFPALEMHPILSTYSLNVRIQILLQPDSQQHKFKMEDQLNPKGHTYLVKILVKNQETESKGLSVTWNFAMLNSAKDLGGWCLQ
jgi:hypothetical protein